MTRAVLNGSVIAESDDVRYVEGMAYFPRESVVDGALEQSTTVSRCFWKGKANYWNVRGDGITAPDAAFAYEKPWPLARKLVSERVAFWNGVEVSES